MLNIFCQSHTNFGEKAHRVSVQPGSGGGAKSAQKLGRRAQRARNPHRISRHILPLLSSSSAASITAGAGVSEARSAVRVSQQQLGAMQAPGAPQPQAALGSGRTSEPLGDQLYSGPNIKNNFDVMNFK